MGSRNEEGREVKKELVRARVQSLRSRLHSTIAEV